MKKLLLVLVVCLVACLLFACEKEENKQSTSTNNPSTVNEVVTEKEYGVVEYKEPNFNDRAGYEVVKDKSLSDVSYDSIFLLDGETSQLDLKYKDGRIATLTVGKSEGYIDEDAQSLTISGKEVKFIKGTDGINKYYWEKDNSFYTLSVLDEQNFGEADLAKVIDGFSINAGENY